MAGSKVEAIARGEELGKGSVSEADDMPMVGGGWCGKRRRRRKPKDATPVKTPPRRNPYQSSRLHEVSNTLEFTNQANTWCLSKAKDGGELLDEAFGLSTNYSLVSPVLEGSSEQVY